MNLAYGRLQQEEELQTDRQMHINYHIQAITWHILWPLVNYCKDSYLFRIVPIYPSPEVTFTFFILPITWFSCKNPYFCDIYNTQCVLHNPVTLMALVFWGFLQIQIGMLTCIFRTFIYCHKNY